MYQGVGFRQGGVTSPCLIKLFRDCAGSEADDRQGGVTSMLVFKVFRDSAVLVR